MNVIYKGIIGCIEKILANGGKPKYIYMSPIKFIPFKKELCSGLVDIDDIDGIEYINTPLGKLKLIISDTVPLNTVYVLENKIKSEAK